MKITELLTEVNIEVLRLIAVNTNSNVINQIDDMDLSLKKFKSMLDAFRGKATELDKSLGFFEKRDLKSDLKSLLKILKNNKNDEQWMIFEASGLLSKLCTKYHVEIVHDEPKNSNARLSNKDKQDDFNPGLEDRIAAAFRRAEEKKAKFGVRADEPVMSIEIEDVIDAAERTAKIDRAIARKKAEKLEQDERAARISNAIERKKTMQKMSSINSEENARYESVMSRKIKELLQNFDNDDDEKGDKVSVRYEYQNDTYYLDGIPVIKKPKRLMTSKEKEAYIKSKLHNKSEFGYLFDHFIQDDMKVLKNCDPYIIEMLMSKDIRLARDYIKQMTGNPYKKMASQEFSVVYDVRGLESGKGYVSSRERRAIRKMAKQQRNAANVIEDKRKLPWYATIPVIGALAVGAIAGITASNNTNQNKDRDELPGNSYSDTIEPGTTYEDDEHIIEKITTESNYEFSTSKVEETTYTTTTTSVMEEQTTLPASDNNKEEKNNKEKDKDSNIQIDDTETDKDDNENIIVNIGDKIMVQDGLKYTANCLGGGNSNRIGAVSWRPATEYNVEKVAFIYKGKALKIMNRGDLDVEQTLKDIASQNGINSDDITTSVLISLVPGTADTGWANISIEDMKHNISKPVEEQSTTISHIDIDFDR